MKQLRVLLEVSVRVGVLQVLVSVVVVYEQHVDVVPQHNNLHQLDRLHRLVMQ
jgi:hypothetical protein